MKYQADWRITQWRFIKSIANNDLSRMMGLVPLAGYLILFNDEIARLASFDSLAGVSDQAESTFLLKSVAKLRLMFFGSLFVFVSCVIYRIWRPPVLDGSSSDIEFSGRVREHYTVQEIASIEAQVYAKSWQPRLDVFWTTLGGVRTAPILSGWRPDVRQVMLGKHGDYISFLAREWWVGMMHTNRSARIAALFLGVAGYFLLAIPPLDIVQAVVRDILWGD